MKKFFKLALLVTFVLAFSLPASAQQFPDLGNSAFWVHPANCSKYSAFLNVRPFPSRRLRYYGFG